MAVTCPTCGGDGVCYVLAAHTNAPAYITGPLAGFVERPCSVCDGAGEVSDKRGSWMEEGLKLRVFRTERDMGLREAARWLGVSPVEWSDAEHGKSDPNGLRARILAREFAERQRSAAEDAR